MSDLTQQVLDSTSMEICVSAAPGAGKTTAILIPKIKQILAKEDAKDVLLLTFSRMSAADLKKKVQSLDKTPTSSTVHSYALSFLLSENNHDIRKRVDNIMLGFEKNVMISDLKLLFPAKHRNDLKKMLDQFSAAWAQKQHEEIFNEDSDRQAFKQAVINWLHEHEAAAMEEIMYHAVNLAQQVPDSPLIEKPKYIFVDEFQDLNKLEQEFVMLIAQKSNLLLVVGDPDQSIYSFKYAHREGMKEFGDKDGVESYEWYLSKRCPKAVIGIANQFLMQETPTRKRFVSPLDAASEGEVRFIRKDYQEEEFRYILEDIARRLTNGARPNSCLVLVPKIKLGQDFAKYANANKESAGITPEFTFSFLAKTQFTEVEQEAILKFGLLANPASLLHFRTYLGMGDQDHFADEIKFLKEKYGNLRHIYDKANPDDIENRKQRVKRLCTKIVELREFIKLHKDAVDVPAVIDLLFPNQLEFLEVRELITGLKEEGDTIKSLFGKFLDQIRDIPIDANTIPVMTIMASKGLDSDHVYIAGCNAGNIPGENRSTYLSDLEYRNEQLRLFFVGVTRAKQSLHITWCRYLPYGQIKTQNTASIRTVKKNGTTYGAVGISDFLSSLRGISWQ